MIYKGCNTFHMKKPQFLYHCHGYNAQMFMWWLRRGMNMKMHSNVQQNVLNCYYVKGILYVE